MNWRDGIEEPHLAIASSNAPMIGVLAGPGTGKTSFGLMRRVARLLSEGTRPEKILLISFTRTAARDLRDKVSALGVDGADKVRATTLHSFCFSFLHRDEVFQITQRHPRPLMEHEANLMLRDLEGDFGDLRARQRMLEAFQAGWARGAEDHPGLANLPADKHFEQLVLRWLKHHRCILIGEVVPLVFHFLSSNISDQLDFEHIIVDEYQDLNFLEQRLLSLMAEGSAVCIAGDDDQSIYGFRHANPQGIHNFLADPAVERHEIVMCGRCPRLVLSMANSLISQASNRSKPPLACLQATDGTVDIVQWDDVEEEAEGIVAAIAQDIQAGKRQPGDILVLTHRRKIGEAIRNRLRTLDIAAHSFFTEEAVANSQAQEALALLRLAVEDDPVSLRVILGVGDAAGRSDGYRRLSQFCRDEGITERAALDKARSGEKLKVSTRAFVPRYERALKTIESLPLGDDLASLVDVLFPETVDELADLRAVALDVLPEVESVKQLADAIVTRVTQVDVPPSPDYVRIMSLHKSKGLTSPAVFVAGLVEGIVPTIISNPSEKATEEAVEEQRRLLYVAITRAADQLVLSFASSMELALANSMGVRVVKNKIRRVNGELRAPTIASRYLAELGSDAPPPVRGVAWLSQYGE